MTTTSGRARSVLATLIAAAAFCLGLNAPANASGPCLGATHYVSQEQAWAKSFMASEVSGCTGGVASGAATMCGRVTVATAPNANEFNARWANESARIADTMGGCVFMCTSYTCRVGNDGLPVELLGFGVE